MSKILDQFDAKILRALQVDGSLSQRDLAEHVGLSQNACWRRLRILEDEGFVKGRTILLDRERLGLGLVVFMMIKTRHHSKSWLEQFRNLVSSLPQVVDFYRIGGEYDYMLKVVARDMANYDTVYQRLIEKVDLESVTSYFAMEAIEEQRPIPV